jgi:hypothetical protein
MSVIEGIVYNPETGLDERRPLACDEAGRQLAATETAKPASRAEVFAIGSPEGGADTFSVQGRPIGRFVRRVFRNAATPQAERVLALTAGAGV